MKKLKIFLFSLIASTLPCAAQTGSAPGDTTDLPESMMCDIDSLLNEWKAQKYLYPDTTCENPNLNPIFGDDVYIDRLSRIPAVMEMPYNDVVKKYIDQYSGRLRRSVSYMLGAGNFYIPIFEEALGRYDLPLELKYLPVIESALNPIAKSRAGAVGLWQFILSTGKRYDLQVNSLIDERQDPIKSSFAAARYLKDLYKIYGDWNLVIAAYNCGPGNVNKAIQRADGVKDYWAIYPYLPRETRGYVPAFIAANYIMNYYCEHNICPMKTSHPITTDTIVVTRNVHMQQISELCNIDIEAIKGLNPQYKTEVIPGHSFPCTIRLPQENISRFIALKDSVYNHRADQLFTRRNTVVVKEPTATKSKKSKGAKYVTIRNGDTLGAIARRHGTTVSKLKRLNGIKGTAIRAGRKIRVR